MIYKILKKIGSHSMIYGIGNMSFAIPGFILIPLYTRYLEPFEYGIFSLLGALFGILLYIYEFGMVGALSRQFYDYASESRKKAVTSTAFFFILAYCFCLTAGLYLFRDRISGILFKTRFYSGIISLGLIAAFFQALIFIPQTIIRLREKPVLYVSLSFFRLLCLTVLTVFFLVSLGSGLRGVYKALLFTSIISFCVYFVFTRREFIFKFSLIELRHLLYLGLAFFPALLLTWIIESSDRYILNFLTNLSEVGVYSLGYKLGQISMLIVKSFYLAWVPIMFSMMKSSGVDRIFGKICTYFILALAVCVFSLAIFSREILTFLATPEYAGAAGIIFLISFSYLFYGLYIFFLTGMTIKKKVYSIPAVLLAGAATNIFLNFTLIPLIGITGAAAATLVSYIMIALLTYFFSQRNYYIFYETGKLARIIIFGALIYAISLSVNTGNIYVSISAKSCFVAAYIFILYISGIISRADARKLKTFLTNITSFSR